MNEHLVLLNADVAGHSSSLQHFFAIVSFRQRHNVRAFDAVSRRMAAVCPYHRMSDCESW
jgi:hypothetical protein